MESAADNWSIEIEGLEIVFDGRQVVRDFSLRVSAGEKVLLIGPSGSGKSTILLCVLGFLRPNKGEVRIEGQGLTKDNVWDLRQRMVWVAQEPELGAGSVREVLERPFSYRANAGLRGNLERVPEYLRQFRLDESILDSDAGRLSGGEKQRVALITALLLERRILLLDEPSSALDAESKRAVMDFLRGAEGMTILSVSHDREWAETADRVVHIFEGVRG